MGTTHWGSLYGTIFASLVMHSIGFVSQGKDSETGVLVLHPCNGAFPQWSWHSLSWEKVRKTAPPCLWKRGKLSSNTFPQSTLTGAERTHKPLFVWFTQGIQGLRSVAPGFVGAFCSFFFQIVFLPMLLWVWKGFGGLLAGWMDWMIAVAAPGIFQG